jgi:hypothetical protein
MGLRSKLALFALIVLLVLPVSAFAGRKRIVVLDFEGPKNEKFHDDLVHLIKKSHTVVATDKWNGAAEELDAAKPTEKNIKKVAKKLKVDGVITGKIEKRRDEYILHLKLRAGATGEIVGSSIDAKADSAHIEGQTAKDLKDELISALDDLASNRGGGDDDDDADAKVAAKKPKKGGDDDDADAKPKKSKKHDDDDDADAKPKKSKKHDDDDDADAKPKKGFARHDDEAKGGDKVGDDDAKPKKSKKHDDDDAAALSTKKGGDDDGDDKPEKKKAKKHADDDASDDSPKKSKKHKHASADDDGGGGGEGGGGDDNGEEPRDVGQPVESALALSPGHRAIDAEIGLSFTARKLAWSTASSLVQKPPTYSQGSPVAGGLFDVTVFPLAFNHDKSGPLTGLGAHVMYDRVIKISSNKAYTDATGNPATASLQTQEDRFTIGVLYRYPIGSGSQAPVVGGGLEYSKQNFAVAQALPNGMSTDIPNVAYGMIEPNVFGMVPFGKFTFMAKLGYMAVSSTGAITTDDQYGAATASGYEGQIGADFAVLKNLVVRAEGRYEKITLKFKGDPTSMADTRDMQPGQDVFSASDSYYGFIATVAYLF